MKSLVPFLFLIFLQISVFAQRVVFGNLEHYIEDFVETLPVAGSNLYQDPFETDRENLGLAMQMMVQGKFMEGQDFAALSGYEIIRYIDNSQPNNRVFYALQPMPGGDNYWGIFFLNPNGCRNLIIQCPHPKFDNNTGREGAYIFTHLDVKGLMISGTHRCNSITKTICSGTTTACGSSSAYRISDIAHNDESLFQTITNILAADEQTYFLQLHGFAKSSGDPNLIISNGTRLTPESDPIADLRNALLAIDSELAFKIVHIHTDWTRLTAFTNTQGRFLNNSSDPCFENATSPSGRFIHIEQEFDRFRRDENGWELMRQGLENVFACEVVTAQTEATEVAEIQIIPGDDRISVHDQSQRFNWIEVFTIEGLRLLSEPLQESKNYTVPDQMLLLISVSDRKGRTMAINRIIWVP